MKPVVKSFFEPITSTFSYVVFDAMHHVGVIIDPVLDYDQASGKVSYHSAEQLLAFVRQKKICIDWILETHAHADHLSAAQYIKSQTNGKVAIGEGIAQVQKVFQQVFNFSADFATDGSQFDHRFTDNEEFFVGELTVKVLATPGHTNDSVTYVIGDAAFIGDTLFHPDVGTARCDFPGGDAAMLYKSIQRIFALPADTRIFLCHDYPEADRQPVCQVSIAQQKARNIHLGTGITEQDFVMARTDKDQHLAVPKLLYPAIQVNIAAGQLPIAEDNGQIYLKTPVKIN